MTVRELEWTEGEKENKFPQVAEAVQFIREERANMKRFQPPNGLNQYMYQIAGN